MALNLIEPLNPLDSQEFKAKRKALLDGLALKQPFRVAIGKSQWVPYTSFDERYNLREILRDEVVIEFDSPKPLDQMSAQERHNFDEMVMRAIGETGINLMNAGYDFEYWDHWGKSPHLHIRDLPITQFDDAKRKLFKEMFIKRYVPKEYHHSVDLSLAGIKLIALEWAPHWKGCYQVKTLTATFIGRGVKYL